MATFFASNAVGKSFILSRRSLLVVLSSVRPRILPAGESTVTYSPMLIALLARKWNWWGFVCPTTMPRSSVLLSKYLSPPELHLQPEQTRYLPHLLVGDLALLMGEPEDVGVSADAVAPQRVHQPLDVSLLRRPGYLQLDARRVPGETQIADGDPAPVRERRRV